MDESTKMTGKNFTVVELDRLKAKFCDVSKPQIILTEKITRIPELDNYFKLLKGKRFVDGIYGPLYDNISDVISTPPFRTFGDSLHYYSTMAWLFIVWTNHESRLNRSFGDTEKSDIPLFKEHIVGTIGAYFLSAHLGFDSAFKENAAADINNCLKQIGNDRAFISEAVIHAKKAVELLNNIHDANNKKKVALKQPFRRRNF